jgi:hypothetical protein
VCAAGARLWRASTAQERRELHCTHLSVLALFLVLVTPLRKGILHHGLLVHSRGVFAVEVLVRYFSDLVCNLRLAQLSLSISLQQGQF